MGRPPHAHWDICVLQPVLDLIQTGYQNLEVYLVEADSTGGTISKGGYETDAEPMESRVPKVARTVKDIYFIREYSRNTRPI